MADFPALGLPAPKPSTKVTLAFNALGANLTTVGAVKRRLDAQLDRRGYDRRSYYSVPGGFAVITQAERIEQDGRSAPDNRRWNLDPAGLIEMPHPFTIGGLLAALKHADPGRYRVIAFLVTTANRTTGTNPITISEASGLVNSGGDDIPPDIASTALGANHHLVVLIYEFSRRAVNAQVGFDDPSPLDARRHLRAAGLIGGAP